MVLSAVISVVNDEESNGKCGLQVSYGCCGNRKRWPISFLQRFATPKWALVFLSVVGFLQGFVISGLVNVSITSLEKRFGLPSVQSGLIPSSYNLASLVAIPFVTYLGGKGHKPLWIGWGIILMGAGCFTYALPHFTSPHYVVKEASGPTGVCGANRTSSSNDSAGLNQYLYLFILAQIMNGLGTTGLYTLGMTYLDENVSQKSSSIYHGVYFAFAAALGPAAGYILGGYTLHIYTEISQTPALDVLDPSWIGAWWLGFVVAGALLVAMAVPLLMFPRDLPGSEKLRLNRESQIYHIRTQVKENAESNNKVSSTCFGLGNFASALVVLLKNPPFVITAVANALDLGLVAGFSAFTPKYLESTYGLSATDAAVYLGAVTVTAGAIGMIVGGLVVSKANLEVRGIIKFCLLNTILALACGFVFFIKCPNLELAGSTVPYANQTSLSVNDFNSACNLDCRCATDTYDPVCGADAVTYFSPCFAGCTDFVNGTFSDCSCVVGPSGELLSAKRGKCEGDKCSNLPLFLSMFFLLILATFMCWTPNLQIAVRIVPFDYRSLAVGFQWVLNRALGGIPIPIVVGKVLDLACCAWSSDNGEHTTCRMYFNQEMSFYLFLVILFHKICGGICYGVSLYIYKAPNEEIEKNASTAA